MSPVVVPGTKLLDLLPMCHMLGAGKHGRLTRQSCAPECIPIMEWCIIMCCWYMAWLRMACIICWCCMLLAAG